MGTSACDLRACFSLAPSLSSIPTRAALRARAAQELDPATEFLYKPHTITFGAVGECQLPVKHAGLSQRWSTK